MSPRTADPAHLVSNPFGHQQGAWTATADYAAKATTLHVQFAGEFGPAQGPVRTDTTYTFTTDCTTINAFAYDLRFYGTGQDPLDPTDGTPGFSGTGNGRLLTTGI